MRAGAVVAPADGGAQRGRLLGAVVGGGRGRGRLRALRGRQAAAEVGRGALAVAGDVQG